MKNNFTPLNLILVIFFSQSLIAQVPKDFEFMDHRARVMNHMESKIVDNKMFIVHNVNTWPMTSVNVVDMETHTVDTLLGIFNCLSDLGEFSDGTFDVYLHSLFDYDIGISGFIHIAYDGSSYQVDTLHSYILNDPDIDDDVYAVSAVKNNSGGYYLSGFDNMYLSDKTTVTPIDPSLNQMKLFQNDAKDVYAYRGSTIIKLDGLAFDTIHNLAEGIREIKSHGPFNDVLTFSNVQRWNDDFSQLLKTWPVSDGVASFYQLHVGDSLLTVQTSEDENYQYYQVSEAGDETILESGTLENEEAIGFHFLSDDSFLAIQDYMIPEINSRQLVYRHIDLDENQEYDHRQISMDSLSFFIINRDTLSSFIGSNGDTLYFVEKSYNIEYEYTNNSDTSIYEHNVISSETQMQYFFETAINNYFNVELQTNETVQRDTSFFTTYGSPQVIYLVVPGADYRINDDPNRLISAAVVVDVETIVFDEEIKIYPNPARDFIQIDSEARILELAIYDVQGQLMMYKAGHSNLDEINVSALSAGSYYIKIRLDKQEKYSMQQFIKM